jgi:hypothetical protein
MRYLSVVFFALTAMLMLASPGVMAQTKIMNDVNTSCGYDVFTDCTGCHYDPEPTYGQKAPAASALKSPAAILHPLLRRTCLSMPGKQLMITLNHCLPFSCSTWRKRQRLSLEE